MSIITSPNSEILFPLQFRLLVSEKFKVRTKETCLIFAGKIMNDSENLKTHNIKDGVVVHLVIRTNNQSPNNASTPRQQGMSYYKKKLHLIFCFK